MDNFDSLDPCSRAFLPEELQRARQEFRSFYRKACMRDTTLMDTLVLVRIALDESLAAPRYLLSWRARMELEKICNENEQAFMYARDMLHRCAGFQRLPLAEQMRIAVRVFDVCHVAD